LAGARSSSSTDRVGCEACSGEWPTYAGVPSAFKLPLTVYRKEEPLSASTGPLKVGPII